MIRLRRLAPLLVLGAGLLARPLLGAPGEDLGEDPGEEPEFIEEDIGAEEGRDAEGRAGRIGLSDGSWMRGGISLTRGRRIRVFDQRSRRVHYLDLDRVAAIRTLVETEGMEEAWAFEEEGFRRKVKLGWKYPRRTYRQEVQLRTGQVIEGHCYAAVLWVDDGRRERKVILPRVQKGTEGKTLDDLVYPQAIDFDVDVRSSTTRVGPADRVPFASLRGRVEGASAVAAIEERSLKGFRGGVRRGSLEVAGLLPGRYSLFLRQGRSVRVGMPEESGLGERDRAAVRDRIAELAEFFEDRRIVLTGGSPRELWLLLELRRRGTTTLPDGSGGSMRVVRWEMWILRKVGTRWEIRSRIYLDRVPRAQDRPLAAVRYRREPSWHGVELRAGVNEWP